MAGSATLASCSDFPGKGHVSGPGLQVRVWKEDSCAGGRTNGLGQAGPPYPSKPITTALARPSDVEQSIEER